MYDIEAFARGGLTLELFAPCSVEHQTPHAQDEFYFVIAGSATLIINGIEHVCAPGDALLVPARAPHRFTNISDDFATWTIF